VSVPVLSESQARDLRSPGHGLGRPVSARAPSAWKAWLAVGLWLCVIALESSELGSFHNTSRILYPLFHFLFGVDRVRFEPWLFFLRKCGHVFGYALLSILFFRAWRLTIPVLGNPRWSLQWARIAVLLTALVASLDEWHQTFNPSRTGAIRDVVLDSAAALAAQVLVFLWVRWV